MKKMCCIAMAILVFASIVPAAVAVREAVYVTVSSFEALDENFEPVTCLQECQSVNLSFRLTASETVTSYVYYAVYGAGGRLNQLVREPYTVVPAGISVSISIAASVSIKLL